MTLTAPHACPACQKLQAQPHVSDLPAHLKRTSPMTAGDNQQVPPPRFACADCGSQWAWNRPRGMYRTDGAAIAA